MSATIREATDAVPGTTEDHYSCIKVYPNEHRWRREDRKISNGKGSLDHRHPLQLAKCELEIDKAVDKLCIISFEFSTSSALHCW